MTPAQRIRQVVRDLRAPSVRSAVLRWRRHDSSALDEIDRLLDELTARWGVRSDDPREPAVPDARLFRVRPAQPRGDDPAVSWPTAS